MRARRPSTDVEGVRGEADEAGPGSGAAPGSGADDTPPGPCPTSPTNSVNASMRKSAVSTTSGWSAHQCPYGPRRRCAVRSPAAAAGNRSSAGWSPTYSVAFRGRAPDGLGHPCEELRVRLPYAPLVRGDHQVGGQVEPPQQLPSRAVPSPATTTRTPAVRSSPSAGRTSCKASRCSPRPAAARARQASSTSMPGRRIRSASVGSRPWETAAPTNALSVCGREPGTVPACTSTRSRPWRSSTGRPAPGCRSATG
ncbi:hypothetical protein SBADM41S_07339 [Streptomyces badius]